ncbi:MAG TPA: hypothetical protein VE172_00120, partial [Stackebrandtia sp.]|nr:hypothetical protein [Stackebrandtia sp.]
MSLLPPPGPVGVPSSCQFTRHEVDRLLWWVGDTEEPAEALADFCRAFGVGGDLSHPGRHDPEARWCGVAV